MERIINRTEGLALDWFGGAGVGNLRPAGRMWPSQPLCDLSRYLV